VERTGASNILRERERTPEGALPYVPTFAPPSGPKRSPGAKAGTREEKKSLGPIIAESRTLIGLLLSQQEGELAIKIGREKIAERSSFVTIPRNS